MTALAPFIIAYPQVKAIIDRIEMCRILSQRTGEPNCMALEGRTGAGKTTLIKAYSYKYQPQQTEFGKSLPIFYMETPSPVTVKMMASRMLEVLGDPSPNSGTQAALNSRLVHYIRQRSVDLVVLDDIQHLIEKRLNSRESVTDWLKVLIKEAGIPFVVIGQEGEVLKVLEESQQLSRLFAAREKLQAFATNSDAGKRDFDGFVSSALNELGLALDKSMDESEFYGRMFSATEGLVANIINLLQTSALLAEQSGAKYVTQDHLRDAYGIRLQSHVRKPNPFAPAGKMDPALSKVDGKARTKETKKATTPDTSGS